MGAMGGKDGLLSGKQVLLYTWGHRLRGSAVLWEGRVREGDKGRDPAKKKSSLLGSQGEAPANTGIMEVSKQRGEYAKKIFGHSVVGGGEKQCH